MNKAALKAVASAARSLADQCEAVADSGEITTENTDTLRRTWLAVKYAARIFVRTKKK